jgi:hypothetical protein
MELFAYETYMVYADSKASFDLTEKMIYKLKLITLATLGQERRATLHTKGGQ